MRTNFHSTTWQLWDACDDAQLLRDVGPKIEADQGQSPLLVVTWNIAAVNNNPFEYWVTHGQTSQVRRRVKIRFDSIRLD